MTDAESAAGRAGWSVVLALAWVNAIGNVASIATPLWVGDAPLALGLPAWTGGALASAQLFAAAAANIATATYQRRLGPRTTARMALLVAIGAHLLASAPDPRLFALGVVTAGAALGALSAIVLGAASRFADPHRVFATFTAVLTAFAALFYVVAPALIATWGMAGLFGLLALLCALVLPTTAPLAQIPPPPAEPALEVPSRNRLAGLAGLTALGLLMAAHVAVVAYAVPLGDRIARGGTWVSLVLAVANVASIAGSLAGGGLGERLGRFWPPAGAIAAMAGSALLIGYGGGAASYAAGMILFFTATMFAVPYLMTFLASLDEIGRWIAIGPSAIMTGSAVGPGVAAGLIAADYGIGAVSAGAVAALTGALAALALATQAQADS